MRSLVFIIIFLRITTIAHSQSAKADAMNKYMQSALDAYKFSGVALVCHEDQVLINRGFGFSNISKGWPNKTDTKFPILSITKTITAALVLKLQDEGKLSVKDNINKYFPDFPNGTKITIHQLLTHSSGMYNYTDDVGIEDSSLVNNPISKEFIYNYIKERPTAFKPGKYFSYNNSGYFLLGLIIEQVTDSTWEDLVREEIFDAFEMTHSGFDFNRLNSVERAIGYQYWNADVAEEYAHYDSTFAYSAGSIYSTSGDLLQWAKTVEKRQFLEPAAWQSAFKKYKGNYGYGWQIGKYFDKSYVKHSGGYPGYMSELIIYPEDDLIIILLCNYGTYGQNVWSIGMGLTSIALGMPYDVWHIRNDVEVSAEVLSSHVGKYKSDKYGLEIKLIENDLFVSIPGQPDMRLLAESENQFFLDDFNSRFDFDGGTLVIREHGGELIYLKE